MHRQIYFCKSWFAAKKIPTEVWTEVQARDAHTAGRNYTVLIDSPNRPFAAVTVTKNAMLVDFLDKHLRPALSYLFQPASLERYFVTMAVYREYDGATDKVTTGTTYIFKSDGEVKIRRELFVPLHKIEETATRTDVAANYSNAPQFGTYDDFLIIERTALHP